MYAINRHLSILNYTALISYASESFNHPSFNDDDADPSQVQWFHSFRRVVTAARLTSHEITSTLALLSSSITNGQPLPPYLKAPPPYRLSKRMEMIDKDILSIRHMAEPGYAAFAVLQVSTSCISMDLEKLLRYVYCEAVYVQQMLILTDSSAVKNLVGELDFSYQVVPSESRNPSRNVSTWTVSTQRDPFEEWDDEDD